MTWFAASIILGIKPKIGQVESILVYENVVLVEAVCPNEARLKAEEIGEAEAAIDDGLMLNGLPAERVFSGIRKLVNVSNPPTLDLDKDNPTHGTEVTYSVFEVASEEELRSLANGGEVNVRYVE